MPLPKPAERELQHTRRVVCEGYKRKDGLWDIEGHLSDIKSQRFAVRERNDGYIEAGEPLHGMSIRLTVDLDLNILNVEASMDHTPFRSCPEIAPAYKHLIGMQLKPGFTRKTREMFGGIRGCTHLLELLGPVATTAYQATHQEREQRDNWQDGDSAPPMLNGCHTYNERGAVVAQYWPAFFTGEATELA